MANALKMPVIAFVFDRYHKATSSTPGGVELRIAYNWRVKWMSTGIRVLPREWSKKQSQVINRFDAVNLNKYLERMRQEVLRIIYDMVEERNIDIFAIPGRLNKILKKNNTFIDFFEEKAVIRKHGIGEISQGRYDLVARVLKEYGKIIEFSDLTESKIIAFDNYLLKKGIQASTRYNSYHKFLIRFIKMAQLEGIISSNPYDTVRLDRGNYDNSIDKCLSIEEVRVLLTAKMPNEHLQRVRDLFVFQCYTCMSYTDLANFDSKKIEIVNGEQVYSSRREKTNVRFTVPLLPPALAILKLYKGKLPIISNVKYNKYLKEVADVAGIDKKISTHWARHTGATLLLNAGVRIDVVAKVCGHSNTKMTEKIYAKMMPNTVVDAVKEVENKMV